MSGLDGVHGRAVIVAGGLLWLIGLEYFVEAIALNAASGYAITDDTISRLESPGAPARAIPPARPPSARRATH